MKRAQAYRPPESGKKKHKEHKHHKSRKPKHEKHHREEEKTRIRPSTKANAVEFPTYGTAKTRERQKRQEQAKQANATQVSRWCYICEEQIATAILCEPGEDVSYAGIAFHECYVNYDIGAGSGVEFSCGKDVSVCEDCWEHVFHPLPRCRKCQREMLDVPVLEQCRACLSEVQMQEILAWTGYEKRALVLYERLSGDALTQIPFEPWAEHPNERKWDPLRNLLIAAVEKYVEREGKRNK